MILRAISDDSKRYIRLLTINNEGKLSITNSNDLKKFGLFNVSGCCVNKKNKKIKNKKTSL